MTSGILFYNNNAWLHKVKKTQEKMEGFQWECFEDHLTAQTQFQAIFISLV